MEAATSAMLCGRRCIESRRETREGEAVDSVRGRRSEPMQPKDMSTAMIVRPTLSLALFRSSRNRIEGLGDSEAIRSTKRRRNGSGGNGCCFRSFVFRQPISSSSGFHRAGVVAAFLFIVSPDSV